MFRPSVAILLFVSTVPAEEPCKSGLRPEQRPGPYSGLVIVGAERGTQHCFICATADRPMVIVFARGLTDPLGRLVHKLDRALKQYQKAELRSWVTFLAEDHTAEDAKITDWSRKHATGNVPLMVFEDTVGPPTYLLAGEAEVTVLLAVRQKVVANFAYRPGELNDDAIDGIIAALPKIVASGK